MESPYVESEIKMYKELAEHYRELYENEINKKSKTRNEWCVIASQGEIIIASNDFTNDVGLTVTGDFTDVRDKWAYAQKLVYILNKGGA